jgi:enolase
MNVINGGAHANNKIDLAGVHARCRSARRRFARRCATARKSSTRSRRSSTSAGCRRRSGDEGGFAPNLPGNEAALKLLMEAIEKAGYTPGTGHRAGARLRGDRIFNDGVYNLAAEGAKLTRSQMVDYLAAWCDKYPIISIEDGMAENDWDGWKLLSDRLGKKVQLVGDDVFVTNTKLLKQGIAKGVANSILIKINQIGTISETFAAITMACRAGYTVGRVASLGRDRGQHDRRHRRRDERRARSRRARCRARSESPSTTSCCASRKTWATPQAIRAAGPSTSSVT